MRVLITGVAGFIGSNLAEELLRRGHHVNGLDNLSQGSMLNLADVVSDGRFRFVKGDIREITDISSAAAGCECIIHLAAFKIPRYGDAYETLMVNAMGSENVARVAVEVGAKIVAASTSDVYGKSQDLPFREDGDLVIGNPKVKRWAYAVSKMFEEQLLLAFNERFGLDVVLLRFFGVYGPHQNLTWWGGPQSVFIEKALDNEAMPLHGDGSQRRTFTYVTDLVTGIAAGLETPAANNLVINLGSEQEVTIEDLARLVWRLVRGDDDKPKIDVVPYSNFGRYEDVMRRIPDLSRAREVLGYEPSVNLEDGLRRTIRWQIERRRQLGTSASTPNP
jgi:UDP-glucose 4-epimerase